MTWLLVKDFADLRDQLQKWQLKENDHYFKYFKAIMVFNALNFAMTIFALYMLEKMSHATWSEKN